MKTYIYITERSEVWEIGGRFYCYAPAWGISTANRKGCPLEIYRGKVEVLR